MEDLSISDRDLDLDSGLDVDGGDLLDGVGGGVQVNHTLVDPQLEPVPGLGTLSARSLTGGDAESLGRHPHRTLHLQILGLGSVDEVGTNLLQRSDVL